MSREWQFIPTKPDGKIEASKSRKLVQRTALRNFHQRERLARMTSFGTTEAEKLDESQPCGSTQDMGQGILSLPERIIASDTENQSLLRWKATLVDIGCAAKFDPFMSTTLVSDHGNIKLFTYFVSTLAVQIQPLGRDASKNPFGVVFARNALADPLVLSSLLHHTSVHANNSSTATLFHHGNTMRELALRLKNPEEHASDNMIAAVGLLAATGNITGDVTDDLVHWNALQRMIEIRGGLHALGWDGALAMMLSVSDLISSTVASSYPRLAYPSIPQGYLPPSCHIPADALDPLLQLDTASIELEIKALLRTVSTMACQFLQCNQTFMSTTTVIIGYTQVLCAIEHRLLSLRIELPSEPSEETSLLAALEMSRIALLIATIYYFRNMRITSVSITLLQQRLFAAASAFETRGYEFANEEALQLALWSCWMGGLTAKDQDWTIPLIQRYLVQLQIFSWEELRSRLRFFILHPRRHDLHGSSLRSQVFSDLFESSYKGGPSTLVVT